MYAPDPERSRLDVFCRVFRSALRSPFARADAGSVLSQANTALYKNETLQRLKLRNFRNSAALFEAIRRANSYVISDSSRVLHENFRLNELDLSGILFATTDAGLKSLKTLSDITGSIETVSLKGCGLGEAASMRIAHIVGTGSRALNHLDLSHNLLGPEGVNQLLSVMKKKTIRFDTLSLAGTGMTDACMDHLCDIMRGTLEKNTITDLDISYNDITDKTFSILAHALSRNRYLRVFAFGGNSITEKALPEFVEVVMESPTAVITDLSLAHIKIGSKGIDALCAIATNKSLTSLDVTDCKLGKKHGMALLEAITASRGRTLVSLKIGSNSLDKNATELISTQISSSLSSLRYLDLAGLAVGKNQWEPLVNALGTSHLISLSLVNTNLTDKTLNMLCSALSSNRHLEKLNLSRNEKLGKNLGLTSLAALLAANASSISTVILSACKLKDKNLEQIIPALSTNTSLKALQLDHNQFHEGALAYLLQTVDASSNYALTVLDIRGNPGSDSAAVSEMLPLVCHAECVVGH